MDPYLRSCVVMFLAFLTGSLASVRRAGRTMYKSPPEEEKHTLDQMRPCFDMRDLGKKTGQGMKRNVAHIRRRLKHLVEQHYHPA